MALTERKRSLGLIALSWLVYTAAYLGKYSYTSNTLSILADYGVTRAEAGFAGTLFFIAYGAGQIVNGFLCKYYPRRQVITAALTVSALVNLTLWFGVPFVAVKYLWLLNGIAQSVLWPTLLLTLSEHIAPAYNSAAVLAMATTVSCGTVLSYGTGALFVEVAKNYRLSFLTAAAVLLCTAAVWFFLLPRVTKEASLPSPAVKEKRAEEKSVSAEARLSLFAVVLTVAFLAFCGIADNLVKDGLNTWVPSILQDMYGLETGASMLLTIVLSLLGIFGAFVAVALQKKLRDFSLLTGLLFLLSALLLGGVILLLRTPLWWGIVLAFGLLSLLMHSINNVITSMFPLRLGGQVNAGLLSGLLNGACYIGSALSSFGLGAFADSLGWSAVFYLLLACTAAPVLLSPLVFLLTREKK